MIRDESRKGTLKCFLGQDLRDEVKTDEVEDKKPRFFVENVSFVFFFRSSAFCSNGILCLSCAVI